MQWASAPTTEIFPSMVMGSNPGFNYQQTWANTVICVNILHKMASEPPQKAPTTYDDIKEQENICFIDEPSQEFPGSLV